MGRTGCSFLLCSLVFWPLVALCQILPGTFHPSPLSSSPRLVQYSGLLLSFACSRYKGECSRNKIAHCGGASSSQNRGVGLQSASFSRIVTQFQARAKSSTCLLMD